MDPYSYYTKSTLSKTGGLSSPSTVTPLSSCRSICSPYPEKTDATRLADVEVASEDSENAFEAGRSSSSESARVCRFPMPKRLARKLSSSENLSLPSSSESSGIMSATSVFSSFWPFGKQEASASSSSTEELQEEIASGEFSFLPVAAHDFTILHVMKEEPEEEDESETRQMIPAMVEPQSFRTQPRPCSWPVCPPRDSLFSDVSKKDRRWSTSPLSSASASSLAQVDSEPLPVRNTFIHYDPFTSLNTEHTSGSFEPPPSQNRWSSAPGALLSREWRTKYPEMEALHARGECRPCAYVYHKEDGCRWGGACNFCHLCPPGAMKNKKKEKIRRLREIEAAEKNAIASCASSDFGGN